MLAIDDELSILMQLGNVETIETMTQKMSLKFAMDIIKAGGIDELTGAWKRGSLFNRIQLFQELIEMESSPTDTEDEDQEHILLLYFIDIDHFKPVNDTHGHAAGDKVLKELVKVINEQIRDEDAVFRYGGEEFCILQFVNKNNLAKAAEAKGITIQEATEEMVEDFRRSVTSKLVFNFNNNGKEFQITLSMGVVQIQPEEDSLAAVNRADELMYVAKKTGRDKAFFEWSQLSKLDSWKLKVRKVFAGNNH